CGRKARLSIDREGIRAVEHADQQHEHDRQDHAEFDCGEAVLRAGEPGGDVADLLHQYGSTRKAVIPMTRVLPFARVGTMSAYGAMITGHWYMTLSTTTCPWVPGL